MKKRNVIGILILFICCILSTYGCKEKIEKIEKDGYITYKLLENDTYEVSKYEINDKEKKIVIPEEYKGKKVTSISECTFCDLEEYKLDENQYNPEVNKKCIAEEIELPDAIEEIPDATFYYCEKLKKIKTGKNIKNIGKAAFYNCKSLENFDNTDNLDSLGGYSFTGCEALRKFKISDKVKNIPEVCFNGCNSLEEIYIGNNVESIERGALLNCKNIKEFFIPKSVKKIEKNSIQGEKYNMFNNNVEKIIIKCEIDKQPDGWEDDWQISASYNPDKEELPNVLFGQKR